MKFFTVNSPLLTVLAQSASVDNITELPTYTGIAENFLTSTVIPEDMAKVVKNFDGLAGAFAAANTDLTEFFCQEHWN